MRHTPIDPRHLPLYALASLGLLVTLTLAWPH